MGSSESIHDKMSHCWKSQVAAQLLTSTSECINLSNESAHEISNNVVCATSKASDQPAHTRSLIRAFASRLNNL